MILSTKQGVTCLYFKEEIMAYSKRAYSPVVTIATVVYVVLVQLPVGGTCKDLTARLRRQRDAYGGLYQSRLQDLPARPSKVLIGLEFVCMRL